eukprot:TRINITY_DN3540_c1_g1_i2.p1 TRINITY_DN3540_c1_g1~~TRINITY_DN3540_c1_g1_i2.p1  ORF type:complete len:313 (+),score=45.23 TRINITY_DN3540_c1_g1_i2:47-940(+)
MGDKDLTLFHTMVAGSVAGMSEHIVMYPMDTIKTKLMSRNVGWKYSGATHCAKKIIKNEGFRGMYRGLGPAFASAVPAHAALFSSYEFVKKGSEPYVSEDISLLLGAGAATCLHDTVSVPFDVVKQRLQEQHTQHGSAIRCFKYILKTEGPSAFTRSLPATYLLNFPAQAVHWLTYETAKKYTGKEIEERVAMDYFICGAFAGICTAVVTNPLDLVRTRIQLGESSYKNTIKDVYTTHGITGFWRGCIPRMAFQAPSAALTMTSYEVTKVFLLGRDIATITTDTSHPPTLTTANPAI